MKDHCWPNTRSKYRLRRGFQGIGEWLGDRIDSLRKREMESAQGLKGTALNVCDRREQNDVLLDLYAETS